jgi:nucleotide-binding universal stress UspA family protein
MTSNTSVRVLVTFDCTHPNERVLRQLAELLGPADLDVTGLYVEDEDLLRAASLPGLREISLSGQELALDTARIGREIAEEAAAAERAFDLLARGLAAQHQRLVHRFLVARGRMAEEVSRAAMNSDFVVVTRALRATGLRPRLGRSYQELIERSKQVLFVNEPWASGTSVVVLHGSEVALDYGARLAAAEGLRLVIAMPQSVDTARAEPVGPVPERATIRHLTDWREETIADLCLTEDARLLVMAARDALDWKALLLSLIDRLPCSLLKLA